MKRQFFAIFESGNLNIHSNTDSNILFFAIFEYGKIVFRNSITLPVKLFAAFPKNTLQRAIDPGSGAPAALSVGKAAPFGSF